MHNFYYIVFQPFLQHRQSPYTRAFKLKSSLYSYFIYLYFVLPVEEHGIHHERKIKKSK